MKQMSGIFLGKWNKKDFFHSIQHMKMLTHTIFCDFQSKQSKQDGKVKEFSTMEPKMNGLKRQMEID